MSSRDNAERKSLMNKRYCDKCGGEIFQDDGSVLISVRDLKNERYVSGKDMHRDCFNSLFSTDCNLILSF